MAEQSNTVQEAFYVLRQTLMNTWGFLEALSIKLSDDFPVIDLDVYPIAFERKRRLKEVFGRKQPSDPHP